MPPDPPVPRRVPAAAWPAAALVAGALVAFDPGGFAAFGPVKWALVSTLVLALIAVLAGHRPAAVHRLSAYGWAAFLGWGALAAAFGVDLESWTLDDLNDVASVADGYVAALAVGDGRALVRFVGPHPGSSEPDNRQLTATLSW